MTIDEARANVGARVVYRPDAARAEHGVITSVGTPYVFVRYEGDEGSKATAPGDLWLPGAPVRRHGKWRG